MANSARPKLQQKLIFNRLNPISLSESNKKDYENEKDFDNFSHNSNLYSVEGDEFSGKNPTKENNKFKNLNSISLYGVFVFVILFSFFIPMLSWLHFVYNLSIIYFISKLVVVKKTLTK